MPGRPGPGRRGGLRGRARGPNHRLSDQPLCPAHHLHRRAHDRPLPLGRGDAYITIDRTPSSSRPGSPSSSRSRSASPSCRTSVLQQQYDGTPGFLFLGCHTRPVAGLFRRADTVRRYMGKHGRPGISARNTAMTDAITGLPPIAVSDLFGMRPGLPKQPTASAGNVLRNRRGCVRRSSGAGGSSGTRRSQDQHGSGRVVPTKIGKFRTRSSTHSETISIWLVGVVGVGMAPKRRSRRV
jgi:hypothetical protein